MTKFEEVEKARKLLGLREDATLKEIKRAYRQMARRHHPDRGAKGAQAEEMMKQLNVAYKLLTDYCDSYSYSFREGDVARAYPYDAYLRKFQRGWFNDT